MSLAELGSRKLLVLAEQSSDEELLRNIAAESKKVSVLMKVAANLHTPPDALDLLAHHRDVDVRCEVAENKNISAETRRRLARDKSQFVRSALSEELHRYRCKKIADDNVAIYCE